MTSPDPGISATEEKALLDAAWAVRDQAYSPYSGFSVGAALLCENGAIVSGCNVECANFSGTICAERGAIVGAVALGQRSFRAIAVVADSEHPTTPCGACRQLLAELAPTVLVIYANRNEVRRRSLAELLPELFTGAALRRGGTP